jgi:hypothetical protein
VAAKSLENAQLEVSVYIHYSKHNACVGHHVLDPDQMILDRQIMENQGAQPEIFLTNG